VHEARLFWGAVCGGIRGGIRGNAVRLLALVGLVGLVPAGPAWASNEALLRLLEVLRDRGSLTAQEYEDVRRLAQEPEPEQGASAQAPATATRVQAVEQRVAEQEKALAAVKATTDVVTPLVNKALAGKWYERLGLRGYTQFRMSDVLSQEGPAMEIPADRSVNANETFVIRRGRFIFSGDASDHFSLYAQMDFNASTGAADFSLQMRDLYADIWLDKAKLWRVRAGQSKVPYGFVNLQSSQNRALLERSDALNSAVEGERDLGAALMWNTAAAKQRFRELQNATLKGSGDYGVVAVGAFAGQGLNRSDQNGNVHWFGRVAYPFKLASGQYVELGAQVYRGRFVSPVQAVTSGGSTFTPVIRPDGERDQRVALTAVWYPQPFGVEAEWTYGTGPALARDSRSIEADSLHGGYVQVNHRLRGAAWTWLPFARWNYFDGARKFARNAPRFKVNEVDLGVEFARWAEVELTGIFTHAFTRTRTTLFPYAQTRGANRVGLQLQWNY
jgi:hypothetical protein